MRLFQQRTKRLALLLVLCLVVGLVGCQTSPKKQGEPSSRPLPQKQELTVVHFVEIDNPNRPYDMELGKMLTDFTQQTNIEIQLQRVAWDYLDTELVISNRAGTPSGDLYALASQKLFYLVNNKALLPLDDYFQNSFQAEDFSKAALEAGIYAGDGTLYLMLQALHTRGLWYNTDYVPHPPTTLDELVAIGKEISRPEDGFYAFGFQGNGHYATVENTLAPLVWAYGGRLSHPDGSANWDGVATQLAIEFMADCVNTYHITPSLCATTLDFAEVQKEFREERIAMILDGNFSYTTYRFTAEDTAPNGPFAFAPSPGINGPGENFGNGWAWGIPTHSAQPDLAWEFIEWFTETEHQVEHALIESTIPVAPSAYPEMAHQQPLFAHYLQNSSQYSRSMDPFFYYQEAMESMAGVASTYVLDPSVDLPQLLKQSVEEFNENYY